MVYEYENFEPMDIVLAWFEIEDKKYYSVRFFSDFDINELDEGDYKRIMCTKDYITNKKE